MENKKEKEIKKSVEDTQTVTFTVCEQKCYGTRAIAVESVKPSYNRTSKEYDRLGQVGIDLIITDAGLKARVGSVRVGLKPSDDGTTFIVPWNKVFKGWDLESELLKSSNSCDLYHNAIEYLRAKYSIEQKSFSELVKLAKAGIPLLTKRERKMNVELSNSTEKKGTKTA